MDVLASQQVPLERRAERRVLAVVAAVLVCVLVAAVQRALEVPAAVRWPAITVAECTDSKPRPCPFSSLSREPSLYAVEKRLLERIRIPQEPRPVGLSNGWHAIADPDDRAFLSRVLGPVRALEGKDEVAARQPPDAAERVAPDLLRYTALREQAWTCEVDHENRRRLDAARAASEARTRAIWAALLPRPGDVGLVGLLGAAWVIARRRRREPATVDAVGLSIDGRRFRWEELADVQWYPTQLILTPSERAPRRFDGLRLSEGEVEALQAQSDRLRRARTSAVDRDPIRALLERAR